MSAHRLGLVVLNNALQLQRCSLYAHYCAVVEDHHVVPESWWRAANKPVDSPMRVLCPNCHYNTHAAIDGYLKGQNVAALPARCLALARSGIALGREAGLTPALTL